MSLKRKLRGALTTVTPEKDDGPSENLAVDAKRELEPKDDLPSAPEAKEVRMIAIRGRPAENVVNVVNVETIGVDQLVPNVPLEDEARFVVRGQISSLEEIETSVVNKI